MTTPTHRLRLVLLQVRAHRESLLQERDCFVERCGVPPDRFRFINLVDEPHIGYDTVRHAHAVFIGGAGDYSVTVDHPFTPSLTEVVVQLVDESRPLFGSCWGHQFIARALGGRVIGDRERAEVGTFDVRINPAGRRDPLFSMLPDVFTTQLGHNDRVADLPPGAVELATSELCPYQAIRFGDGPVYGSQFHSELDLARLRQRLALYFNNYVTDEAQHQRILASLRPSPAADGLLARFLDLFA
jgi:GMP synthase (glutamine-hydrolysing)